MYHQTCTVVVQSEPQQLWWTAATSLERAHTNVFWEFKNDESVKTKSTQIISSRATDQGHELNNSTMRDDYGFIRLMQDHDSLLRGASDGPDTIRMISEFESAIIGQEMSRPIKYDKQTWFTRTKSNLLCNWWNHKAIPLRQHTRSHLTIHPVKLWMQSQWNALSLYRNGTGMRTL